MDFFPVFLTVVVVLRNQADRLSEVLAEASARLSNLVADHEIVVIDNASTDDSVARLKALTAEGGIPNVQVYALTKEVDRDTAAWVGMENALGDFVAVLDPLVDDLAFVPSMLAAAVQGADVVFARNEHKAQHGLFRTATYCTFNALYRFVSGIDLANEAPQYRLLSKRVVNFILQHPQAGLTYRHLPVTGGFSRVNLHYSSAPRLSQPKDLRGSMDRGIRLLVSTSRAPMRLVTVLSLFGALANLLYSFYVLGVAVFKADVAPGWVSLSLQQSGMFFLISLVLLVLGEYILHMASVSGESPAYHVTQEFCSAEVTRRERLNVERGDQP